MNSNLSQLATDGRAALKNAVQSLASGIDNAINGLDAAVSKLDTDALHAAEAVIVKDAPASIQPFVRALVGMVDAEIGPELSKLDNAAHIDLQLFRSKLDGFLASLV